MLRILIFFCVMFLFSGANAETPQYQEPNKDAIQEQKNVMNKAFKNADKMMVDGSLNKLLMEDRAKLNKLPEVMSGLQFQMPEFLDKERDDNYLEKALDASNTIKNTPQQVSKYPIVLISLSMPEGQIKSLIAEAHKIGAMVAVRGLIDDDFQKTIVKLKQLAGDIEGGLAIDPTLFRRFSILAVPTFILPLEPIKECTDTMCPTPLHVKATGSSSIKYFLDLVARSGEENEKAEANLWLSRYGE